METATSLIDALAWPLTALAIVCLFRADLAQMLRRLVVLKSEWLEINFEQTLRDAEEADRVPEPPADDTVPAPAPAPTVIHELQLEPPALLVSPDRVPVMGGAMDGGELAWLADLAPRAAVLEAWRRLEEVGGDEEMPAEGLRARLRRLRDQAERCRDLDLSPSLAHRYLALARRAVHCPTRPVRLE